MHTKSHWDQIYTTQASDAVSWYQPHAILSRQLIRAIARDKSARVLDVGGGASTLVDDLLADGTTQVSVLDISGAALAVARRRLRTSARRVQWLEGDGTQPVMPPASIDIWHDRAVFHFLTDPADRPMWHKCAVRCARAAM